MWQNCRKMFVMVSKYLEQLEAMSKDKRETVCKALLDTMHAIGDQHSGLADNRPVLVGDFDKYNDPNNDDFVWSRLMCLKWLAEGATIIDLKYMEDFKYVVAGSNGHDYMVTIINRYAFEELLLTLQKVDASLTNYDGYDKSIEDETVPNLAYYDLDSGRGIVNGHVVYLRGRNKKLFKALFLAAPHPIDRETVKSIALYKHSKDDAKIAVNDAFSSLPKACGGVSNKMIAQVGGYRLNARVYPLAFQLFQNTYKKERILPKKPSK